MEEPASFFRPAREKINSRSKKTQSVRKSYSGVNVFLLVLVRKTWDQVKCRKKVRRAPRVKGFFRPYSFTVSHAGFKKPLFPQMNRVLFYNSKSTNHDTFHMINSDIPNPVTKNPCADFGPEFDRITTMRKSGWILVKSIMVSGFRWNSNGCLQMLTKFRWALAEHR